MLFKRHVHRIRVLWREERPSILAVTSVMRSWLNWLPIKIATPTIIIEAGEEEDVVEVADEEGVAEVAEDIFNFFNFVL